MINQPASNRFARQVWRIGSSRFWRLFGLLALHASLGLVCLGVSFAVWVSKVHFDFLGSCQTAPTATAVDIAAWAAFVGWWVAGVVVVWFWAVKRRRAWL